MAKMTTTAYDDTFVGICKKTLNIIKLNNTKPEFAQFLDFLYHLFSGTEHEVSEDMKKLMQAVPHNP